MVDTPRVGSRRYCGKDFHAKVGITPYVRPKVEITIKIVDKTADELRLATVQKFWKADSRRKLRSVLDKNLGLDDFICKRNYLHCDVRGDEDLLDTIRLHFVFTSSN